MHLDTCDIYISHINYLMFRTRLVPHFSKCFTLFSQSIKRLANVSSKELLIFKKGFCNLEETIS